jgi:hypothetical protein
MNPTETTQKPADWKNYEDFCTSDIATNRLLATDALVGKEFRISLKNGRKMQFRCTEKHMLRWTEATSTSEQWYEAILVAPDVYFLDVTFTMRPKEALTLIVGVATGRVLSIRSMVRDEGTYHGEPRVAQEFVAGTLDGVPVLPSSQEPAVTRDLIGLREVSTYGPGHTYEHIYLNAERYCWQCLVGVQRGQGDVDLASYYKFSDELYIFTFREFIIPVASVFFFNFADRRSTGKFLGVTSRGTIENRPAGAFIEKVSMTYYRKEAEPV